MTSDQAIISILTEQVNSYRILLDLLKEERKGLVNLDAEKIEHISKEKDTVVMRLRLLEEERVRLIGEFAEHNGIEKDITLVTLGELTHNELIPELRSRLLSLLQSIEEMNRFNTVLIDRSLQHVRTSSSFFNSFSTEHTPPNTGVLLSKET
ncbi:MAG: flagellar protein FlgN [Nitrospiraceae bacterium]|nr:MAG: flagellar protein FlgN [Nitrospiraceae bacterium]